LSADQTGPRLKASGALERLDAEDAYTAAVVLSSGLVDGDRAAELREIVVNAIVEEEDGRRTVSVPSDVLNPWGWSPSRAEMLAWTTVALLDQHELEWRGDLVAELMAGYDAGWGFGAGPADVIALEAVLKSLPALSQPVEVVLLVDGVEQDRRKLDPSQPRSPAVLIAGETGAIELRTEPAVPGLAFVATLHSWVPWSASDTLRGVDVEVDASDLRVGEDGTVTVTLAAPQGVSLVVEQGLPAGASVDEASLVLGAVTDWRVATDRVRFVTRPFTAGEVMEITIPVRPAFAGRFGTVPLTVEQRGNEATRTAMAPLVWNVDA
jgi:hypothetical protein